MVPPLQVMLLALLVAYGLPQAFDPPQLVHFRQPGWVIVLATLAVQYGVVAFVWARVRQVCRLLYRTSADSSFLAANGERTINHARWMTLFILALQYGYLGFGDLIINRWHAPRFPLLAEALTAAPVLLAWLGFWVGSYQIELAVRNRSFAYRLQRRLPAHEMPRLRHYLMMRARHDLWLLVPVSLALLAEEGLPRLLGDRPWVDGLSSLLGLGVMVLLMPWLLTRIFRTEPLPPGTLRSRLEQLALEHKLPFTDILVWHTHHAVTNAMIVGFTGRARYILMTDALLESLTDRQIEAVFAHEVGHGRHRHIWFFLMLIFGATALFDALAELGRHALPHFAGREHVLQAAEYGAIGLFLVWGFSRVSRRFEHQADWFAARHMAASLEREPAPESLSVAQYLQSPLAGTAAATATRAERLGRGAEAFSSALGEVVSLLHRDADRPDWLHPSPAKRVRLLARLAESEPDERAFDRRILGLKAAILIVFAAGILASLPDVLRSLGRG